MLQDGCAKWMALIFRIGRAYNPNRTKFNFTPDGGVIRSGIPPVGFFAMFQPKQNTTAFKGAPVTIVNGPREGGMSEDELL